MVFLLNDHITDYYSSMYKINDTHLHDDKWEYLISPQILQCNNIFTCTYFTSFTQIWKTAPLLNNVTKVEACYLFPAVQSGVHGVDGKLTYVQ